MAYPTLAEIRQGNAAVDGDGYVLLTLSRPFGPYLAWMGIRLGITPRQVNYFSLVLALVILGFAVFGGRSGLITATALVFLWQIVDVTDGTMARALRIRDNFGGFVDYATGMVVAAFNPLCLGIGAFLSPDYSARDLFAFLAIDIASPSMFVLAAAGGISAIAMYMRLINRILFIRFGDSFSKTLDNSAALQRSTVYLITKNLETVGGVQAFAFFIGAVSGMLDALLVIYFAFYLLLLGAFAVSVYRNYQDRTAYQD